MASAAGSLWAQAPTVPTQPEAAPVAKYDNRWEVYGGMAYAHIHAGPNLVQGAHIGGFDAQGTRWLTPRIGAMANVRGYYGTSGVLPNRYNIEGPFVSEHFGLVGPTFLGPHNDHGAFSAHALFGGAYGYFTRGLSGHTPAELGFFDDQFAFGSAIGGNIDLNRSPKLAMRISPDWLMTRYGGKMENNFAISVGVLYRFSKKR